MRAHLIQLFLAVSLLAAASGRASLAAQSIPVEGFALENGDTNGDGARDLSDPVQLLSWLFTGGQEPVLLADCLGAGTAPTNGDSNGDGARDLSDAVHLLNWLFTGGNAPADACGSSLGLGAGGGGRGPNAGRIIPVQARPYGKSYSEWAKMFWQWGVSIPADENPFVNTTCTLPQDGKVWFIAASFGAGTVTCEVPVGKGIFFPVAAFFNDFPCPDPNFAPAPGQSLEDFLIETVAPLVALIQDVELFIDDVPTGSLLGQRVTTDLFNFTGDPSLTAVFDPCITGLEQQAITDGYFVMVVGLGPGEHSLRVRLNFDGTIFEVTNLVTIVQPGH